VDIVLLCRAGATGISGIGMLALARLDEAFYSWLRRSAAGPFCSARRHLTTFYGLREADLVEMAPAQLGPALKARRAVAALRS
jgi:hypothetical protein